MHCAHCGNEMTELPDGSALMCCGTAHTSGYWYEGKVYIGAEWPKGKKAVKPRKDWPQELPDDRRHH